jgi:precorrin-6A/cobalt-precorrin-6A reductase
LVEELDTETELAAVLAHAIAHIVLRHPSRMATRIEVANLAAQDLPGQQRILNMVRSRSFQFARTLELDADALAVSILANAGFDPAGLAAYLREHAIDRLIDATHPFAARISAEARAACDIVGVPRLTLLRPPWRRHPLDRWIEVDDMKAAAGIVARIGRRAWLTIGAGEIAAFSAVTSVRFLVRLVDPPRHPLPLRFCQIVVGRGPFAFEGERHLIARHAIDVMVCKASGGAATEAKLVAARDYSLPVVMVRRPPPEPGELVEDVDEALDWLIRPVSFASSRGVR